MVGSYGLISLGDMGFLGWMWGDGEEVGRREKIFFLFLDLVGVGEKTFFILEGCRL